MINLTEQQIDIMKSVIKDITKQTHISLIELSKYINSKQIPEVVYQAILSAYTVDDLNSIVDVPSDKVTLTVNKATSIYKAIQVSNEKEVTITKKTLSVKEIEALRVVSRDLNNYIEGLAELRSQLEKESRKKNLNEIKNFASQKSKMTRSIRYAAQAQALIELSIENGTIGEDLYNFLFSPKMENSETPIINLNEMHKYTKEFSESTKPSTTRRTSNRANRLIRDLNYVNYDNLGIARPGNADNFKKNGSNEGSNYDDLLDDDTTTYVKELDTEVNDNVKEDSKKENTSNVTNNVTNNFTTNNVTSDVTNHFYINKNDSKIVEQPSQSEQSSDNQTTELNLYPNNYEQQNLTNNTKTLAEPTISETNNTNEESRIIYADEDSNVAYPNDNANEVANNNSSDLETYTIDTTTNNNEPSTDEILNTRQSHTSDYVIANEPNREQLKKSTTKARKSSNSFDGADSKNLTTTNYKTTKVSFWGKVKNFLGKHWLSIGTGVFAFGLLASAAMGPGAVAAVSVARAALYNVLTFGALVAGANVFEHFFFRRHRQAASDQSNLIKREGKIHKSFAKIEKERALIANKEKQLDRLLENPDRFESRINRIRKELDKSHKKIQKESKFVSYELEGDANIQYKNKFTKFVSRVFRKATGRESMIYYLDKHNEHMDMIQEKSNNPKYDLRMDGNLEDEMFHWHILRRHIVNESKQRRDKMDERIKKLENYYTEKKSRTAKQLIKDFKRDKNSIVEFYKDVKTVNPNGETYGVVAKDLVNSNHEVDFNRTENTEVHISTTAKFKTDKNKKGIYGDRTVVRTTGDSATSEIKSVGNSKVDPKVMTNLNKQKEKRFEEQLKKQQQIAQNMQTLNK